MVENSKIEWTDHTFNPWIGCTKVSQGCANCYAETQMTRKPRWANTWGPQGSRIKTSEAYWRKPLAWNRKAEQEGRRYKVFCGSLCDVFDDRPLFHQWRTALFLKLIDETPSLDWLLLTKRPENVKGFMNDLRLGHWPENVWIGTSVENQETADRRIHHLIEIPANVLFLSVEPLLGPIGLWAPWWDLRLINWVIVGGESGPNARVMLPGWVESIRDQCLDYDTPFFFKQWGGLRHDSGGRLLDGREWSEMPFRERLPV